MSLGGWLVLALAVLGPARSATAQKEYERPPEVDPYTKGDPERLQRAGYRSFGPFLFGKETTDVVRSRLGDVPILWVETAHFRLGSTLEEYEVRPEEAKELRAELARLRERLDGVPARPRRLDPWLRLHLFAMRLEDLHAKVSERLELGVGDARPTLGMRQKFCVLITQRESTFARFTREYTEAEQRTSWFHHFHEHDTLFFGINDEVLRLTDSDLHSAVVHGVTQLLLLSVNRFTRLPPAWWLTGLGFWFARESEPRSVVYSRPGGETMPDESLADWEPLVRGRVEHGATLTWEEMLARPSWLGQPFGDNVVLWSRIDFLMREQDLARRLVPLLHGPPGPLSEGAGALAHVTGGDLAALEERWRAWVLEHYRRK